MTSNSFLLVDVFGITLIIRFGSYKLIAFDIFIRLFSIYLRRYSLTIFIHVFCYYFCWSSCFLLVDVFGITLIIRFGSYKLIAFDIFIRLFSIYVRLVLMQE